MASRRHRPHRRGIRIKPVNVELEEDGMRIDLTIVDTPGFGDNIDNEYAFSEIVGFLERQYDDILAEESRIKRNPRWRDNRVHALLYFITPTGHSLREIDIELMRRLSPRVNVIPVIGKADSMTLSERQRRRRDDCRQLGLRGLMPFAIVGSEENVIVNGGSVRARKYPWGIVEVDNPKHSDFARLRSALLNTHLTDLKEITHDFLYENYRTEKLSGLFTATTPTLRFLVKLANQSGQVEGGTTQA
ncbi:hypothetical protein NDA10_002587 [Ustilago hordei]|nr:hypothetical protein NDA10_002587 [Ustilago hordei]